MNCARCQSKFEQEAKPLFEQLGVPLPTWCPACRVQRRMTWRNDRSLYLRKCDLSGKQMVSHYHADQRITVYHPDEWYSDKWNALDHGRDFDFTRPFFEQFAELQGEVPHLGIDIVNCENSYYCNYCGDDKNCYLDIAGEANEDCYFDLFTKYSKNCVDCTFVYNSELCYEAINCYNCYNVRHSIYLDNCTDCRFCFDMKGCRDCLFSSNQRQKQYMLFNEQLTKEDYEKALAELKLDTHAGMEAAKKKWLEMMSEAIHRDMTAINSENCAGNNIKNSRNCHHVFNVSGCEDSDYLYDVLDAKNCQDMSYSLYHPEVAYEIMSTLAMKFSAFSMESHYCNETFYSKQCNNSSNLFGCIGLNRSQYCILNKQYSKEEYEELRGRIVEHMKKTGEWGQFFPSELSPFAYNETVAQEYYPLSRETAPSWKELGEEGHYEGPEVELPDSISEVEDLVCKQILKCEGSGRLYKIIPQELAFYRRMELPVPRRCPDQRHRDRIALRNPRHLWDNQCCVCGIGLQTSYGPERKVHCEACYEKALY